MSFRIFLCLEEEGDSFKLSHAAELGLLDQRVTEDFLSLFCGAVPAVLSAFEAGLHSVAQCADDLAVQVCTAIFNDCVGPSACFSHRGHKIHITTRSKAKCEHSDSVTIKLCNLLNLCSIADTTICEDEDALFLARIILICGLCCYQGFEDVCTTKIGFHSLDIIYCSVPRAIVVVSNWVVKVKRGMITAKTDNAKLALLRKRAHKQSQSIFRDVHATTQTHRT